MAKYENDKLGTRIKEQYENRTRYFLPRRTYTILRVDGRAFHTFTRGLAKPYDTLFMECMDAAAMALCQQVAGAKFAFVQSDEISVLCTDFEAEGSESWFDGNIQKWVSIGGSIATAAFNAYLVDLKNRMSSLVDFPIRDKEPTAQFDARVFSIPDYIEVENYFIWRQQDAARNSVTLLASNYASHKQLQNVSTKDRHEFIHAAGDNWAKHPVRFKHGGIIRRRVLFSEEVEALEAIQSQHRKPRGAKFEETVKTRTKWALDESTPSFTRNREYLRYMIPRHWENDPATLKGAV